MDRRYSRIWMVFPLLFGLFLSGPGWAGLEICNDTLIRQKVAIAYQDQGTWLSEGWWQLEPEACIRPLRDPLARGLYFYLADGGGGAEAESEAGAKGLEFTHDQIAFCTGGAVFRIPGAVTCQDPSHRMRFFAKIDTGGQEGDVRQYIAEHVTPPSAPKPEPGRSYQGQVLFQSCTAPERSHQQHCTLVGGGRVFVVARDGRSDPFLIDQLSQMSVGQPLDIQGIWVRQFENVVDLVLKGMDLRARTEEEQILLQLQGEWQSQRDAADRFTVRGSLRQNLYAGSRGAKEFLSVLPFCGEFAQEGPYLYSWDNQAGTGLCYLINEISQSDLRLTYLPAHIELHYRRVR